MKKQVVVLLIISAAWLITGCAGKAAKNPHGPGMPDPMAFQADYETLDANGSGGVKWYEFKKAFPDADPKVFMALDLNQDGVIDRSEWQQFEKAHGMKKK